MTLPFSWMYRDPAEVVDEIRDLRKRMEEFERKQKEVDLRRRRRKIRKLLKQAKARELKGQR